jgi:hypothetical protein
MSAGSYVTRWVTCDRKECGNRYTVPDDALPRRGDMGAVYGLVRDQAGLAGWQSYLPRWYEPAGGTLELRDYCPAHRTDGKAVAEADLISDDTYRMPLVQALIIEVLAGRARCGEQRWPLPARARPALEKLQEQGLLTFERGTDRTWNVTLTCEGKRRLLTGAYRAPVRKLLETALHIVQNGEYAPGGTENWHTWAAQGEVYLRGNP